MVAITGKYKNWAYAAGPISSHEIHSNLERKGYKEKANLTARRLRFFGNIKAFAIIQRPEASQEIQDRVQRISQRCPRFSKK